MKKSEKNNSHNRRHYYCTKGMIAAVIMLSLTIILSFGNSYNLSASEETQVREVTGTVSDESGDPLPGVAVVVKGTTVGTLTDLKGNFRLSIPVNADTLVFSYIGMMSQEVPVGSRSVFNLVLTASVTGLEEVVVVGYGTQKKESVVGAIANTTHAVLERRGGVTNLSAALSGQIPGVNIMQRGGEPGQDNPLIYIRGLSTWNEGQPLLLVDGIERGINDIDVSEVESVSVLKDASATAVFGVKGANGVILVTTRRGQAGKTKLSLSANYGIKTLSKVDHVMESYDMFNYINTGIENDLIMDEAAWGYYTPYEVVQYYKKPQDEKNKYLFPNVDWVDEMLKDFASNYRANLNIRGGTDFVKYFGSLAYSHEGDLFKSPYNVEKDYSPGYSYNRFNFRANLDFSLTKTTELSVNLSGFTGVKKEPRFNDNILTDIFNWFSPSELPVRHEDGFYGKSFSKTTLPNPYAALNESGAQQVKRFQLGTDFKLTQKLDVITKGLSASASLSYDNYITSTGPVIADGGTTGQVLYKAVSKDIIYATSAADSLNSIMYLLNDGTSGRINNFDYQQTPLSYSPESINQGQYFRALFYQLSLNYFRNFGHHNISALALMNRRKDATGAMFPNYREDWVGRLTYDYDSRYFLEVNAAYNGSEKFSPEYRFGFFPSLALGWKISSENFMKISWLNELKLRASIGKVGSDAGIPRWQYLDSWTYQGSTANQGGAVYFGFPLGVRSPYIHYFESAIANSELHWETAIKRNIGVDIGILASQFRLVFDYFVDNRNDIFLSASERNIPMTFGSTPVPANLGATLTNGFELELSYRKSWASGWSISISENITSATDKITKYEDPELEENYLKKEGFRIGQVKSQVRCGFVNNWDEVYASNSLENNIYKLPGDFDIIDFNTDGVVSSKDVIPFGYASNRPENTYSTTLGFGYKNFNFMIQFYGVTNINNTMFLTRGWTGNFVVHERLADHWAPDHTDAFSYTPRLTTGQNVITGDQNLFDGSYLRLKTLELSYALPDRVNKLIGLSGSRIFVNGNNLIFWSKLTMDTERGNVVQNDPNNYPMYRLVNFGVNIDF